MPGKILPISFLWLILAAVAHAADPAFAVGDKVQVEVSPYKYEGVVTEVLPGKLYAVKYTVYGKEVTKNFLEKRIKLLGDPEGAGEPKDEEKLEKESSEKENPGKNTVGNDSKPGMSKEKPTRRSKGEEPILLKDEYHDWEDDTGKFKITAKLIEFNANEKRVRLEQKDKQVVGIALNKLSKESQELVKLLSSLKEGEGSITSSDSEMKKVTRSETDPEKYTKLDWSGTRELLPSKFRLVGYQVPESGPAQPIAEPGRYMLESVARNSRSPWLHKKSMEKIVYTPMEDGTGRLFLLSYYSGEYFIQVLDLKSGEVSAPALFPDHVDVQAAHPDGESLLATGNWSRKSNQIVLINTSTAPAQIEKGWLLNLPVEEGKFTSSSGIKFHSARFIDEDHIQIDFPARNFENLTILVELSSSRVIYELKSDGWMRSQVTASNDSKMFGTFVDGEVYLFESLTGRQLGWIPRHSGTELYGKQSFVHLAFSPNQQELAIWRDYTLQIWDLVKSQETRYLEMSPSDYPWNSLCWVNEDYLLMDGGTLYNKNLNSPVWGYFREGAKGHSRTSKAGEFLGGLLWYDLYSKDSKEHAMFAVKLPDRGAIEGTPPPKPPDFLTLEAGTEVAVNSKSNFLDNGQLERIRTDLINNLKGMQLRVVEDSPLVFTAEVTKGEPQQTTFIKRRSGQSPSGGGTEETVTSVRYISKVTLTEEGVERWFGVAFGGGAYGVYELKEGESIQSIVNRDSKPYVDYFKKAEIPTKIERKPENFGKILGQSRLTPEGAIPEEIQPPPAETPNQLVPNVQKQ